MSPDEKGKANKVVNSYSKLFREQAKTQYGKDAKVKDISAESRIAYDSVWPTFNIYTTGDLVGTVKADGETFQTRYIVESNEIYSLKNYNQILDSMNEYFGYLNLDIIDSTIYNNAYIQEYLPDNITSYEDMLNNEYCVLVKIYVTNDLSCISKDDFFELEAYWNKYNSYVGSIVFVQVEDKLSVSKLKKEIDNIDFSSNYRKSYDNISHDYVDTFDLYNINSSVYISYSDNELKFKYMNK